MLLEINHLEKVFRTRFSKEETRALQDVDFKVEQGNSLLLWESLVREKQLC